jgi:hypothetical protein
MSAATDFPAGGGLGIRLCFRIKRVKLGRGDRALSNPDHFIDEVTEAVRRDKQFKLMRKYGWIGVLLVLLIVGGAAYNEWRKASERAQAEALGDAILAALNTNDPAAGREALAAIEAEAEGDARTVIALLMAAADVAHDRAQALAGLRALAEDPATPPIYRDLATLKLVAVAGAEMSGAEKSEALAPLAAAGAPFRVLAEEQIALAEIEAGNREAAISRLQALLIDDEASQALRRRAAQLIVALGAEPGA